MLGSEACEINFINGCRENYKTIEEIDLGWRMEEELNESDETRKIS